MEYFFGLIFISWLLIYYFLGGPGGKKTLAAMRVAEEKMESAATDDEKREAAKQILEIIENESLAGSVVDKTRAAALAVLG